MYAPSSYNSILVVIVQGGITWVCPLHGFRGNNQGVYHWIITTIQLCLCVCVCVCIHYVRAYYYVCVWCVRANIISVYLCVCACAYNMCVCACAYNMCVYACAYNNMICVCLCI